MVSQVEAADNFPSLSFLNILSLVLCLASISVTAASLRWYLDPTDVAQVFQFFQKGTSIGAFARGFAVSSSTLSRA